MKHVIYALNPEAPLWTLELDYIYSAIGPVPVSSEFLFIFTAFKKKSYALKVESEVVLS